MARRIVGIRTQRQLMTVPVVGPVGCVVSDEIDCCDGGSGSGSGSGECVSTCDQCSTMSNRWTLTVTGYEPITLTRVENPNDGNECRFVSDNLTWDLYYDYGDELWLLVNYDTEELWFLSSDEWTCLSENLLTYDGDGDSAVVTPELVCLTYNCVDGTCVPVVGDGGTYLTLSACEAECGEVIELSPGEACDFGALLPSDNANYLLSNFANGNNGYYYIDLTPGSEYYISCVWTEPYGPEGSYDASQILSVFQEADCCAPPGEVMLFANGIEAGGNVLDCHTFIVGASGRLCFYVSVGGTSSLLFPYQQFYVSLHPGACGYCANAPSYTLGDNQSGTAIGPGNHVQFWYSLGVLAAGIYCLAHDQIGNLDMLIFPLGGSSCGTATALSVTPVGDPVTGLEFTANGTDTIWISVSANNRDGVPGIGTTYNFTVNSGACPL